MAAGGPFLRDAPPEAVRRDRPDGGHPGAASASVELAEVLALVRSRLPRLGIEAEVTGRPKNLWSIYEKMVVRGKEFDEIHDLVGIRDRRDAEKDCWAALGSVHALWPPVQGRFKDYINSPKFNLYQSLHTTVVGPRGKPLEIQIRTQEMHRRAEHGIAAHWGYKEGSSSQPGAARGASTDEIAWLQRIVDWERDTADPVEFLETLKLDLEQDEVYVFTPKGEIMTLPAGATPVDFAYAIHTEVGHRCIGARVNGRLVPLDAKLHSGDTVEIFTSKIASAGPSGLAEDRHLTASRNKIRQWFSRERREDAIETGREELAQGAAASGLPVQKLAELAGAAGESRADSATPTSIRCYAALGEGHISGQAIVQRLSVSCAAATARSSSRRRRSSRGARAHAARRSGIYVEGLDDVMVRLSPCCTPVPGDAIIGFVTRGRGVSVHREDCAERARLAGDDKRAADRGRMGRAPQWGLRRRPSKSRRSTATQLLADVAQSACPSTT